MSRYELSTSFSGFGKSIRANSSLLAKGKAGATPYSYGSTSGSLALPNPLWCEKSCAGANLASAANSMIGRKMTRQCTAAGSMTEKPAANLRLKKVFALTMMRRITKLIASEDRQKPIVVGGS